MSIYTVVITIFNAFSFLLLCLSDEDATQVVTAYLLSPVSNCIQIITKNCFLQFNSLAKTIKGLTEHV